MLTDNAYFNFQIGYSPNSLQFEMEKKLVYRINDNGIGPELLQNVFHERGWTEYDQEVSLSLLQYVTCILILCMYLKS